MFPNILTHAHTHRYKYTEIPTFTLIHSLSHTYTVIQTVTHKTHIQTQKAINSHSPTSHIHKDRYSYITQADIYNLGHTSFRVFQSPYCTPFFIRIIFLTNFRTK